MIEKYFQECSLPYKTLKRNPRWGIDDRGFYATVTGVGNKSERFDVFAGKDTSISVLDWKPDIRHILLMVKTDTNKAKYLFGHDERHLFIAPLDTDAKASNVQEAFDDLRPVAVKKAVRECKKVVRQGEWFFVPVDKLPLGGEDGNVDMYILKKESIDPDNHRGNPHIAEELIRVPTSHKIVKRPISLWSDREIDEVITVYDVFVRGVVRHGQHSTVKFRDWHQVFGNMEIRDVQRIGYLD